MLVCKECGIKFLTGVEADEHLKLNSSHSIVEKEEVAVIEKRVAEGGFSIKKLSRLQVKYLLCFCMGVVVGLLIGGLVFSYV